MTIGPIRNETDYDAALAEIDRLMGVDPDTPASHRLEVLVTLVEEYESARWDIDDDSGVGHGMERSGRSADKT